MLIQNTTLLSGIVTENYDFFIVWYFSLSSVFLKDLYAHSEPTSAIRATAQTLTQAGHVARKLLVSRGAAKRGRGGKRSFVYKRVNYNALSVKSAHSAFTVGSLEINIFYRNSQS